MVPPEVSTASCGCRPTPVAVDRIAPSLSATSSSSSLPSSGTRTGPSGPASDRCRGAPVVGTICRTAPVAASNSTTPSGSRTPAAAMPDVPTTMPSGAPGSGTTVPTGSAESGAWAGSAAGVVAGVVAGEGDSSGADEHPTSRRHMTVAAARAVFTIGGAARSAGHRPVDAPCASRIARDPVPPGTTRPGPHTTMRSDAPGRGCRAVR
ncbi:unannotated protein [freshwater metagenome]|uniref:Unannotated protein n=1 Tax=freshwater metagenome TaxID=449393 RepID=A0A6J7F8U6_9ZZZZ